MSEPGWGWRIVGALTVATYLFMLAPILVTVLLAFNSAQFGGFPLKGLTLHWFAVLARDGAVVSALETSLLLGSLTAAASTALGVCAALALARHEFPGKQWMQTLHMAPILLPETAIAVGLLLFLNLFQLPRTYALLFLGHVVLSLPYVVLVVQARLGALKPVYEEAARSLGATPAAALRQITLPLLAPAIVAGAALAFTISFDNITATLFWRPPGVETLPTQIYSMLHTSVSPEINALGALMIALTVVLPALAAGLSRYLAGAIPVGGRRQGLEARQ